MIAPRRAPARLAMLVGDGVDAATRQAVAEACARAHAEVRVWRPAEHGGAGPWPALVIAPLSAGARRLPDEIIEVADRQFPGTPVLLVCDEPLLRPTVTLQRGRLTLIEPPATVERMASRIRLLLAGDPSEANGLALASGDGAAHSREYRRESWWAAELLCQHGAALPRPSLHLARGLTAALVAPDVQVTAEQVERATEIVLADDDNDLEAVLARMLGAGVGLVHLSEDAQQWLIYWPCHDCPLWLFSPSRLPRWSDLAHASEWSLWRLPAVAGDVIAMLSSATTFADSGSVSSFLPSTEVSAAMLDGGPALLELFESRLSVTRRPFSCVLVEVR